jgi:hypothetical protein
VLKKHGDGFARLLDAHTEDNECLVVNTYPVECDVAEAIDRHIHVRFLKSQVKCRKGQVFSPRWVRPAVFMYVSPA